MSELPSEVSNRIWLREVRAQRDWLLGEVERLQIERDNALSQGEFTERLYFAAVDKRDRYREALKQIKRAAREAPISGELICSIVDDALADQEQKRCPTCKGEGTLYTVTGDKRCPDPFHEVAKLRRERDEALDDLADYKNDAIQDAAAVKRFQAQRDRYRKALERMVREFPCHHPEGSQRPGCAVCSARVALADQEQER